MTRSSQEKRVRVARSNVSIDRVEFFRVSRTAVAARHGPIFVTTLRIGQPTRMGIAVAAFKFNGLAKYGDHELDGYRKDREKDQNALCRALKR